MSAPRRSEADNPDAGSGPGAAGTHVAADGSLTISAGTTDHGQGHASMYTQILCDKLGLPPGKIRVLDADTDHLENGSGTCGSLSSTCRPESCC